MQLAHAELHSTSLVAEPAQHPRIHEVHEAAVPGTSTSVSLGEGVVTGYSNGSVVA